MLRSVLAFLVLLALLTLPALAADMAGDLKTACAGCHSLDMLCDNLGKDKDFWRETLVRMADLGSPLPGGGVAPVADYLVGLSKATAPFCR